MLWYFKLNPPFLYTSLLWSCRNLVYHIASLFIPNGSLRRRTYGSLCKEHHSKHFKACMQSIKMDKWEVYNHKKAEHRDVITLSLISQLQLWQSRVVYLVTPKCSISDVMHYYCADKYTIDPWLSSPRNLRIEITSVWSTCKYQSNCSILKLIRYL